MRKIRYALNAILGCLFVEALLCTSVSLLNSCSFTPNLVPCCDFETLKNHFLIHFIFGGLVALSIVILFLWRLTYMLYQTKKTVEQYQVLKVLNHFPMIAEFQKKAGIPVHVIKNEKLVAFAYGYFKPKILVSSALIEQMDSHELQAILEHECHHCLLKVPLKKLIFNSTVHALYFFPILKHFYQKYLANKEIEADQYAIERTDKKTLATALYKMLRFKSHRSGAAVNMTDEIDLRIQALLTGNVNCPGSFSLKAAVVSLSSFYMMMMFIVCLFIN
ncbi:M56 family metallopeptidase [Scopulibacillus cellulosilyticus]|uniref:M56 family metallopeptidase n=1 Tax=Scopulibacillus cellulosilyticus TaxID=2665665 RepID=A0ABW2PVB3_9BACL